MGSCLSKKNTNARTPSVILSQTEPINAIPQVENKKLLEPWKKEIFVIKHRKSHEVERPSEQQNVEVRGAHVRTSSKGNIYCGSMRSYDFDNENDGVAAERVNCYRNRHRSRSLTSFGEGWRRSPSREREQWQQQPWSGSRESSAKWSGRRVSRSPGRRSESPNTSSYGVGNSSGNGEDTSISSKPQKMVSVPATVVISKEAIERIHVKRNVGGGGGGEAVAGGRIRTTASHRARSPAIDVQNQQPIFLSRSNSRKNEESPFRRNPQRDIDTNVVLEKMFVLGCRTPSKNASEQKLNAERETKLSTNVMTEGLKPQGVARRRPSRLSRDLDINPFDQTNSNSSYTSMLLEDIQNFHQKNTAPVPAVTPPYCVSKAHSILEAVADVNSSTASNLSSVSSENMRRILIEDNHGHKQANPTRMRKLETSECFVNSQVVVADDDLMQPSFHKYVTVRRGTMEMEGSELKEQES